MRLVVVLRYYLQLSDAEIQRRLTFIEERLDDQQFHAAFWEYGWLTIVGGGGIAAATQAALEEEGSTHQINNIAQAGKAMIGVTYLSLNPMPATCGAAADTLTGWLLRYLPSLQRLTFRSIDLSQGSVFQLGEQQFWYLGWL